ncbi:MAG: GGDEF domain-containing protein [Clostridiales bacterium]|nr:GGDEF domain-containing protein [Clostridiales bacterium]
MKKDKIAVFGNGWSDEYVITVLNGIMKGAKEYNVDLFVFLDYVSNEQTEEMVKVETKIFTLPNLEDFEGVILLGNTFNKSSEIEQICKEIREKKIPSLSLEYCFDGIDYMGTDNYSGMAKLTEHLIQVHNVKNLIWIGGPEDNKESQERYQAVTDTAKRFGITIPKENILCGYWSYYVVQDVLAKWMDQYHELPDAILCANDLMAIGVCTYLKDLGYKIPEQVIVTGFDHLESGQTYYPAITSIDRGWNERGYQGIQHLMKLINGDPVKHMNQYLSAVAVEESCGCVLSSEQKERQLNTCCTRYSQHMDKTFYDWHLSGIDASTSHIKNKEELTQKLSDFFKDAHSYEGNNFGIYLDTNYIETFEHDSPSQTDRFSEEMDVVFLMKDSVVQSSQKIKTRQMLANYNSESKEAHSYLFFGLHDAERCIGYTSLCDVINMLKDYSIHLWLKHVTEGIKRTQQSIRMENLNHKLEQISMTDELTGLYNRLGYEKIAIPYLNDCCNKGDTGAIMVVDINKMKVINDEYGHLNGDLAIKVVAQTIHENLPESWSAVRYGGDEFVLLGKCPEDKNVEDIKSKVIKALDLKTSSMQLPFSLGISIGSVLVNPDQNISMEEYFKMADKAMYQMKHNN